MESLLGSSGRYHTKRVTVLPKLLLMGQHLGDEVQVRHVLESVQYFDTRKVPTS